MDFRPGVFVEYRRQFPLASGENRTVGLVLKIRIDWCKNFYKRIEATTLFHFIFSFLFLMLIF